jgi:hypothetical protein
VAAIGARARGASFCLCKQRAGAPSGASRFVHENNAKHHGARHLLKSVFGAANFLKLARATKSKRKKCQKDVKNEMQKDTKMYAT